MDTTWQIQEAKSRLSEVIERALKKGPQLITRRGEKTVVVLAYSEYEKLRKSRGKLSDFFRATPLANVTFSRDKSANRDEFKP
jgi:antitoxin Phd